jgi:uncharacterized LabA/DUF88 family protein
MSHAIPPVNTPGQPTRQRAIVYIDGFNLYFGLRDSGLRRYLWLNVVALAESLLRGGQELVAVRYFTSRVSGPSAKQQRQKAYLDVLATLSEQLSIHYGKYQESPRTCRFCQREDRVPGEKMTDVNIAVEMLTDAFQERFDTAILVSGDSDLHGPVQRIRSLFPAKRVVMAFPPGRRSLELQQVAAAHFQIGRAKFAASQFPDEVKCNGFVLRKPPSWA